MLGESITQGFDPVGLAERHFGAIGGAVAEFAVSEGQGFGVFGVREGRAASRSGCNAVATEAVWPRSPEAGSRTAAVAANAKESWRKARRERSFMGTFTFQIALSVGLAEISSIRWIGNCARRMISAGSSMRGERFFIQSRSFSSVFSFMYLHSLQRHGSVGRASGRRSARE